MRDIIDNVLQNHYKESHSIVKTTYNYYPIDLVVAEYGAIQVPTFKHQNMATIPHSSLMTCQFCQTKSYSYAAKQGDYSFCATCANNSGKIAHIDREQDVRILDSKGTISQVYYYESLACFELKNQTTLTPSDFEYQAPKVAVIKLRENIDILANRIFAAYKSYRRIYTCWTCDNNDSDPHFECEIAGLNLSPIICVSCYRIVISLNKERQIIKLALFNELPIIADIQRLIKCEFIDQSLIKTIKT